MIPDLHYAAELCLLASLAVSLLQCRKYKHLSEKDRFTGTFHRYWFDQNLVKLMKEAKSNNTPLGVAFLDLDNFKEINDSNGHAYGDQVLLSVVKSIRSAIGKTGKLARYGGDEFVYVAPSINEGSFSRTLFPG
ncbi:MAG: GGDEF domain-containing protein [Planctomycetota bacterium]|jgi:diguanylate cyclase